MTDVTAPAFSSPAAARRGIAALLIGLGLVEAISFAVIVSRGSDFFIRFVWSDDTGSYTRVAEALAHSGQLTATTRTLGYPLLLTPIYYLFGPSLAPFISIAIQLALNLVLTYGGWRLLTRLVPDAGSGLLLLLTAVLGWAGMGIAFRFLTDLLGGLTLFGFVYGLLFWRRPFGVAVAALSLLAASLLRPTFTLFPVLIPMLAWVVARITSRVPWKHVVLYVTVCISATCVNVWYQYRNFGYWGPSAVVSLGLRAALFHAVAESGGTTASEYDRTFFQEIERRTGRPMGEISPGEEERVTKAIFNEHLRKQPWAIVRYFAISGIKYTLAPIEYFVLQSFNLSMGFPWYAKYVRPVLFALCLPLWLLGLFPPLAAARGFRFYWLLLILLFAYLVGVSAMLSTQGERYRFPVVAFMLPVVARNAIDLRRRLKPSAKPALS